MRTAAATSLTTSGTPNLPNRVAYCICRPRSTAARLTTADQRRLDDVLAPEFALALETVGIVHQALRKTYRCGSAEVPPNMWSANDPTPDPSILQPRPWLTDVIDGMTDVLVLDGVYAISANPTIMLPVTERIAEKGGIILVINMDGSVSVYGASDINAAGSASRNLTPLRGKY